MKHPSKITLLIIGLLLVSSCSVLTQAFSLEQQDLDWYAEPLSTVTSAEPFAFSGYTPSQIKSAYNLPASGGEGMTIAVIIAYHTANIKTYLEVFSQAYGLPLPTDSNFEVHKMATYIPSDAGWSIEACLDVEWAHAIAPNATILLVEAVSNSGTDLVNAINYATARSDVDVVTMSWGTDEFSGEASYDYLFSNPNMEFFAASGDNGSVVMWPSVSSNVVAVGGTSLNIGSTTSETAWSGSGGGISLYEPIPSYQINYGLNGTKRVVPDVAYNADSSTGVRVYYNNYWYIVGGTSAGSPQWAGIYALGLSASHENLYYKASTAHATYFRDIVLGSTSKYSAAIGYDYITGLGSPLNFNFSKSLDVSPTSGSPGTAITLTGNGISGNTIDTSYLDPITSTWVSISNNTAVTSGIIRTIEVDTTINDLNQSNPSGNNPQSYDNIIFRAVDDNGIAYYTTVPFSEYRRGLNQVGNLSATGIYGNNTLFETDILPQSGNNLTISGSWFSPGNATLLWDTITIGTVAVDYTGAFTANIIVPTTAAGYHTLTIQDNTYNFTFNIATQPTVNNNYDGQWKTSDFTVTLSADSTVDEIYYRINDGPTQNVTASGQPIITTPSANNTLEYWCNWTLNGVSLETEHVPVVDIKLDKTAPTGQVMANPTTTSQQVTLHLSAIDMESGVTDMCFSNDGSVFSSWETYSSTYSWTLSSGEGSKMVIAKFINGAGLISTDACEITLDLPDATSAPQASTSTSAPIAPQATQSSQATNAPTDDPTATPVPEFSFGAAVLLLVLASLLLVLVVKKRQANMHS